ncbi:hypothetical protein RZS08_24820, partial [Arthrospira platensis SPKY1]|nr:hypothetical protein [Arthrospira platensis SPKY1]
LQQALLQRGLGNVLEDLVQHLVGKLQAHAVHVVGTEQQVVAVLAQDALELHAAEAQATGEVGVHQGVELGVVEATVGQHGEGKDAGGGGGAVGVVVAHGAVSFLCRDGCKARVSRVGRP